VTRKKARVLKTENQFVWFQVADPSGCNVVVKTLDVFNSTRFSNVLRSNTKTPSSSALLEKQLVLWKPSEGRLSVMNMEGSNVNVISSYNYEIYYSQFGKWVKNYNIISATSEGICIQVEVHKYIFLEF
jgi:hypothetical protein